MPANQLMQHRERLTHSRKNALIIMMALLPLISFFIVFLIFQRTSNSWRSSVLSAAVVWGLSLTAITEFLSMFKLLSFAWLLGAWIINISILSCIYFLKRDRSRISEINYNFKFKNILKQLPFVILLFCGVAFIVAAVGLIAIVAPPNNWDSMDYHMSRVVHWMQNNSVADYPTSYTPQLYQNPWAEFVILHFQILSGGDFLANLVQWFSMLGSIIGVSLIAKQLGADLRGQVLAAVVSATIPMGILQSSSTQNDYVLAFWLVCFAYYILVSIQEGKKLRWATLFNIGASMGLAILTKGTAYFYIFPFFIWLLLSTIRYLRWKFWRPIVLIGSLSVCINLGHYLRNYTLFGSPIGSPEDYKNEIFGIPILISNIFRNVALHLGTPISLINGVEHKFIKIIHQLIGVNINDPRTTFTKEFFVPGGWPTLGFGGNENNSGNLIHFWLILITIAIFIAGRYWQKQRILLAYLLTVSSTFIVFCYLLKWQPWHSRLHLSLFVLFAAFVGVVLSKILPAKIVNTIAVILIISSLPWALTNRYRPLVGENNIFQTSRIEQYFNDRPLLRKPYIEATGFLKANNCSNVGLYLGNDPWEYPFWVLLHENKQRNIHLEHVNVNNISAITVNSIEQIEPCAIIALYTKKSKLKKLPEVVVDRNTYALDWEAEPVEVFTKQQSHSK